MASSALILAQLRQILVSSGNSWWTANATRARVLRSRPRPFRNYSHATSASSAMDPVKNEEPRSHSSVPITDKAQALQLTPELIHHLERTSLVDFDNMEGLRRLEQAVEFANQILEVDTTGVQPMHTVLEEIVLHLREDKAEKTSREDILKNAAVTEDDYFVSPPGNIPLEADTTRSKY